MTSVGPSNANRHPVRLLIRNSFGLSATFSQISEEPDSSDRGGRVDAATASFPDLPVDPVEVAAQYFEHVLPAVTVLQKGACEVA